MMIFVLATSYLFAVYMLLALAKKTGKKTSPSGFPLISQGKQHS